MIALVILLAVLLDFAIGVAVGKFLRAGQIDDVMALADAVQSDTPIHDRLVAELDPMDPAAVERIKTRVEDELAARRGRA